MDQAILLELEQDIEISNKPLLEKPTDIRAQHCKTAKELDLWRYSSNYQTYKGGSSDLQIEVGVESGGSSNLSMYN